MGISPKYSDNPATLEQFQISRPLRFPDFLQSFDSLTYSTRTTLCKTLELKVLAAGTDMTLISNVNVLGDRGSMKPRQRFLQRGGEEKDSGARLTNRSPVVQSPQSGSRCPTWWQRGWR